MTYQQELNDLLTIKQDKENELLELKNKFNDVLAKLNEIKNEIFTKQEEINEINENIIKKHDGRDIEDIIISIQQTLPNHEIYILSSDINKSEHKKRILEYLKNNDDKWIYKTKILNRVINKRGYKLMKQ